MPARRPMLMWFISALNDNRRHTREASLAVFSDLAVSGKGFHAAFSKIRPL